MTLTTAAIFKQIASRESNASEKLHGLLLEYGLHDAADALANDAKLQQQRLAEALASLHAPDAQQKVLAMLTDAAATTVNMSFVKGYGQGRADKEAEDAPLLADRRDRWVKIERDTLRAFVKPGEVIHLDVFIAPYGQYEARVTRAFYAIESKQWLSAENGREFGPDEVVTHYRFGSRPE